jgi:hypothetical protein
MLDRSRYHGWGDLETARRMLFMPSMGFVTNLGNLGVMTVLV